MDRRISDHRPTDRLFKWAIMEAQVQFPAWFSIIINENELSKNRILGYILNEQIKVVFWDIFLHKDQFNRDLGYTLN